MSENANKNEVILTGKLVNHKTIPTKTGTSFFTASIMTARKDARTGQWINSFFPIKAFKEVANELAAAAERYIKPKVTVKGKLSCDEYKDKEGNKKSKIDIMVFSFEVVQTTNEQGNKVDKEAVEDVAQYNLKSQIDDIPW